ncbi:MucBP domain-containing protein [Levilactobacillus parabrevis]|uniref:MucBP domain-containing protein n=1 Tax=Levilactobacillus parabrevis TaxID=357278 RepID=UPI0037564258
MYKMSKAMCSERQRLVRHKKCQYLGLLGVSLFSLSLSQMKPVSVQADVSGESTEVVAKQSRESTGDGSVAQVSTIKSTVRGTNGLRLVQTKQRSATPPAEPSKDTEDETDEGLKSGTDQESKPAVQNKQQAPKSDLAKTSAPTSQVTPSNQTDQASVPTAASNAITVHYYKKGSTNKLAPDEVLPVTAGKAYTVPVKTIAHYRLVNQVNTSGLGSGASEAYFYYDAKSYKIKVRYIVSYLEVDEVVGTPHTGTLATKVLTVKYGEPYTIPVLNFEDDGIYVINKKLPKTLTGTMGGKSVNVNIYYAALKNKEVINSKKGTLTSYLSDPNGVLRYAELDESEASHTILIFSFSPKGKPIEVTVIDNNNGDHKQKLYFAEGQKLAVTLLDGSQHVIQVKNGMIYDQTIAAGNSNSAKRNQDGRATVARANRVVRGSKRTTDQGFNNRQVVQGKTQLPQTADRVSGWMRVLGIGLLVLANMGLLLRKKRHV